MASVCLAGNGSGGAALPFMAKKADPRTALFKTFSANKNIGGRLTSSQTLCNSPPFSLLASESLSLLLGPLTASFDCFPPLTSVVSKVFPCVHSDVAGFEVTLAGILET